MLETILIGLAPTVIDRVLDLIAGDPAASPEKRREATDLKAARAAADRRETDSLRGPQFRGTESAGTAGNE